jgi:flagellar motor protein MotB
LIKLLCSKLWDLIILLNYKKGVKECKKRQLKAYGVANLCPVFSNLTEAGRAHNRRVEIVEQ